MISLLRQPDHDVRLWDNVEREESGEGERGGKGERLLQHQHDWLVGAVSQRQMSDDCLLVAGYRATDETGLLATLRGGPPR
jgi:hypothetical protein